VKLIITKASEFPFKKKGPKPFVNDKGVVKVGGGLFIDAFPSHLNLALAAFLSKTNNNDIVIAPVIKHGGEYYPCRAENENGEPCKELPEFVTKTYVLTVEGLQALCVHAVQLVSEHEIVFKP
jgi:hypothetical protein